ncbi:hypothetical protein ACOMHN_011945 [Nucella lapillus]
MGSFTLGLRVGDPDRQEMDVILLLSQRSVYVAWYDDEDEEVKQYQRIFLEDVERLEIGSEPAVFKSRFACLRVHYRHFADEGFFHTFRIPSMRLFNNVMVAVKNQEEAKESLRAIAQAFVSAQEILSLELPVTERNKLDRKKSQPHPEVVDVHQQQHEDSLASIHLPRDVSADMRDDALTFPTDLRTADDHLLTVSATLRPGQQAHSPHRYPHRSPHRSPLRSPQSSPSRSPLLSPQRAAENALNLLSQISAKTSTRNLAILKPSIKVNLANLNPLRQLRQQAGPVETRVERGDVSRSEVVERRRSSQGEGPQRWKSADLNMSHAVDAADQSAERGESGAAASGSEAPAGREEGAPNKVMLKLKQDWQEISLDSCGILATSPTHLLVSSFRWDKTLRQSLDLDFDLDPQASSSTAAKARTPSRALPAESSPEQDAWKDTTPDADLADVFDDEGSPPERTAPQDRSEVPVQMRLATGRLRKSSSAEDVMRKKRVGQISDEESYCVLEEEEVAAILHKSQQLQHPHMKTSLSDNALMLQQKQAAPNPAHNPLQGPQDRTAFSRLKMKISTLAVPRPSPASRGANVLNVSKSHIRKSQRAMEVFERLVREKLVGSECQSRIIFI